jgi:hypothetical protein
MSRSIRALREQQVDRDISAIKRQAMKEQVRREIQREMKGFFERGGMIEHLPYDPSAPFQMVEEDSINMQRYADAGVIHTLQ